MKDASERSDPNPFLPLYALAVLWLAGCQTPSSMSPATDSPGSPPTAASQTTTPEAKAVAFLVQEVPSWSRENGCYSCHNNGDAARALFTAATMGYEVPSSALADTIAWLAKPESWHENKGDPGFSDQRLAQVQFASALACAMREGHITEIKPLEIAAAKLLEDQHGDGTWPVGPPNSVGSPATYGTVLSTVMALQVLDQAGLPPEMPLRAQAEQYLLLDRVRNVVEAAAQVLFLNPRTDAKAISKRAICLDLLRRVQSSEGGWGPYPSSPAEVFDTALVVLALAGSPESEQVGDLIEAGRAFLVAEQLPDGGWTETTRPSGSQSYAQRISTTGWATLALLATSHRTGSTPAN